MPLAAAAIPAIAGVAGSVIGGLGGAANTRPPSLDKTQSTTLDSLLNQLYPSVSKTPTIDPVQRNIEFGNIAQEGVGANNRVTNALTSRGLGRSGLLAQAVTQNSLGVQAAQNQTDLALQQQAISQRNTTINQIMQLLGVSNIPGQSKIGGFLSGFAGPFAKTLASLGGGGSSSGGGMGVPGSGNGGWSGVNS